MSADWGSPALVVDPLAAADDEAEEASFGGGGLPKTPCSRAMRPEEAADNCAPCAPPVRSDGDDDDADDAVGAPVGPRVSGGSAPEDAGAPLLLLLLAVAMPAVVAELGGACCVFEKAENELGEAP